LGWQIGFITLKYIHAFVSQRVDQIQNSDKQKGNTKEKEIIVV